MDKLSALFAVFACKTKTLLSLSHAKGAEDTEGGEWKTENGKVKTENYPPPPSLCSSSHLSQGDKVNGKRKTENGFKAEW